MDLPELTKKEHKLVNKIFKPKPIHRKDDVDMLGALKMTWYFEGTLSKLVLSLAMFSLLYSIVRILVQGFW
jgi:hypothetical protein